MVSILFQAEVAATTIYCVTSPEVKDAKKILF